MGREKMRKCRICKTSVPNDWQTFCLHCGARIYVGSIGMQKEGLFARSIIGLKNFFRSEEAEEADKLIENSASLAIFCGPEAVIPEHEEAARLSPKYKSILAGSYAAAGTARAHSIHYRPRLTWGKEERLRQVDELTKPIVSVVRKLISGKSFYGDSDLDKAFNGALEMFDKSIDADPKHWFAYFRRAHAFRDMADNILMAYDVYPKRIADSWARLPDMGIGKIEMGQMIEHGKVQLGFCSPQLFSKFEFAKEIVWLYERAEEDYRQALELDQTRTECYIDLSDLLGQLGMREEASDALNKALSILNKALQADSSDTNSYQERAEVYERLDNVKLAIADLEHALTLETREYNLKSIRDRIEALRKMESKS